MGAADCGRRMRRHVCAHRDEGRAESPRCPLEKPRLDTLARCFDEVGRAAVQRQKARSWSCNAYTLIRYTTLALADCAESRGRRRTTSQHVCAEWVPARSATRPRGPRGVWSTAHDKPATNDRTGIYITTLFSCTADAISLIGISSWRGRYIAVFKRITFIQ